MAVDKATRERWDREDRDERLKDEAGIPNPGSPLALERGCICAEIDNHYGVGFGRPPCFWITEGCPLHAPRERRDPGIGPVLAVCVGIVIGIALFLALSTPADAARVIEKRCPTIPAALGCVDVESRTIWVRPDLHPATRRLVLAHERGHIYSHYRLDPVERLSIQRYEGWRRWREERFADSYALCHVPPPTPGWGQRDQIMCQTIRSYR